MVVHRPTPAESVTLFRSLLPSPLPEIGELSPHDQKAVRANTVNNADTECDFATLVQDMGASVCMYVCMYVCIDR